MSVVAYFGKLLIVTSLFFHAYLLFQDKAAQTSFDRQLNQALDGCKCLGPQINALLKQHLRLVVAGLLASSALMLVSKCWCFKLPVLLGLGVLLWINHRGVFCKVPTIKILDNTDLWHALGVIGAVLYLAGSECGSCKAKQGKVKKQ